MIPTNEGLGRLHGRRAPARPAADHRAARGARRRGLRHRSRVRADAGDPRAARDPVHVGRRARRRPRTLGKGGRSRGRSARLARLVWGRRPRAGDRPRLGRPRGRLAALPHPLGADAGLRVRRPAAPDRLPGRAPGAGPDSIPVERLRRIGAKGAKLVRYPGLKEEYYLADFEPDAGGARRARARPREGPRRRPPAARDLRVPRPQRPLRRDDPAPGGGAGAQAVVVPRTEAPGGPRRGRSAPAPGRPRAGDRRPEPDRLRRPRRQRRGDDEPGGGRARHPGLHHLRRAHGGRRRGAGGRRAAAGPRRAGGLPLRKREAPVGVLHARDAGLLVDGVLGAVDGLV